MGKELLNQLGNVVFLLKYADMYDSANVANAAIRKIKALEIEVKDLKEEKESLEGKLIRKKVRKYNNQQFEGE